MGQRTDLEWQDKLAHEQSKRELLEEQIKGIKSELESSEFRREQAEQARAAFLTTVSHEVLTPMNAIRGFTELVLAGKLSGQQREYLELVQHSSDLLQNQIRDIISFSQMKSGGFALKNETYDIERCVEEVIRLASRLARESRVELSYSIAADVPQEVVGDEAHIRQVLFNLVSNSLRFTEEGYVKILITIFADELRFCVEDTGVGMDEEMSRQLFQRGQKAESATQQVRAGAGLGLAICNSIIEEMGGEIRVLSAPGEGSRFQFWVPSQYAGDVVPRIGEARQGRFSGKKVLLVTAQKEFGLVEIGLLGRWGLSVKTASLEELREGSCGGDFDVVLIDDGGGLEELEEVLRGLASFQKVPRILFAWELDDVVDDLLVAKKVQRALVKPVVHRELWASLDTELSKEVVQDDSDVSATVMPRGRLLIVDDNEVNLRLLSLLLNQLGFECEEAYNGQEALAALQADSSFKGVLMDLSMPVMDGLEATRELRKGVAGITAAELPVVIITASFEMSVRTAAVEAGANGFLTKPLIPGNLKKQLQELELLN